MTIFQRGVCAALFVLAAACARAQSTFPDVPARHWAAESVGQLARAGIVTGYSAAPPGGKAPAAPAKKAGYNGNKPVTRYELAVTLYRFVQYLERADKQRKSTTGARATPISGAAAAKSLIARGYLPKNTPLVQSGGGGTLVTANQLADAMAQIIARHTERKTPLTPDSERAPIARPGVTPGT